MGLNDLPLLAVVTVLAAAIALLWIYALRRGVEQRTAVLNKTVQSLKANTEWLSAHYNDVPCGYHSLNEDGIFVSINDTELRWLGCTREEILGKLEFTDFLDEAGKEKFRAEFALAKTRTEASDAAFELVSRGGQRMSVIVSNSPLRDRQGGFLMLRSTVYDVTQQVRAERALRATLSNTPSVAVQWFTLDGRVRYWNSASTAMFGWNEREVMDRTLDEIGLYTPEQGRAFTDAIHGIAQNGTLPAPAETVCTRKDGSHRVIVSTLFPVPAPTGEQYFACMDIDVTDRKAAEEGLRRVNRMHTVLSNINVAMMRVKEPQTLFDEACRIAAEHGGFGVAWIGLANAADGHVHTAAWAGADAREFHAMEVASRGAKRGAPGLLARCMTEKRPVFENDMAAIPMEHGTRRHRAVELGYRSVIVLPLIVNDRVIGLFGLMSREQGFFTEEEVRLLTDLARDVGFALEVLEKENRINHLAYYDSLTGLPNRTLMHERISQSMHAAEQRHARLAVAVVDMRRFRFVSESQGRAGGDQLLREVASRFRKAWREPDNVGRLARDRFILMLDGYTNESELALAIEHFLDDSLKAPFTVTGTEIKLTACAGVAVFPADGEDADTLFRNAEAALNQAKAAGEPYMFYQPRMNARMAETLLIESRMRRALDKKQFTLHYQPKEAVNGQLVGFEALIRWEDPEGGLVSPGEFIPILEETGMIVEAGQWAMRRVLHDQAAWRARGLSPPRIAVNVSAIQLRRKDFIDKVRELVNEFTDAGGVPSLDLEITESLLMDDIEGCIAKLKAIRDLGVNIAIDDFGTGYSSLAYLSRLPVNALKIDRSFIHGMLNNQESMLIVSSVISLAHAMKIKVIAEGVETMEQLARLRSMECDEIQGYLIGKPMTADSVVYLLGARAVA